MAQDFWRQQHLWPADPSGYVFLARAVEKIGQAMFGPEWTGKETTTEPVVALPEQQEASTKDQLRAYQILKATNPEFAAKERRRQDKSEQTHDMTERTLALTATVTPDDWSTAQHRVRAQINTASIVLRRFASVQREIAKHCESGELISAIRYSAGGAMMGVPRESWNTERWPDRFIWCKMNPKEPYS